jgi:hypothetical protein
VKVNAAGTSIFLLPCFSPPDPGEKISLWYWREDIIIVLERGYHYDISMSSQSKEGISQEVHKA